MNPIIRWRHEGCLYCSMLLPHKSALFQVIKASHVQVSKACSASTGGRIRTSAPIHRGVSYFHQQVAVFVVADSEAKPPLQPSILVHLRFALRCLRLALRRLCSIVVSFRVVVARLRSHACRVQWLEIQHSVLVGTWHIAPLARSIEVHDPVLVLIRLMGLMISPLVMVFI